MFANRFAANNRIANRFAAVPTTKTSEVSPLQSINEHIYKGNVVIETEAEVT